MNSGAEEIETEAEVETESETPPAPKPDRRLTDAEWAEIKELYELGKMKMASLADKYGISRQSLFKRFKKDGLVEGSRAHEVQAAIAEGLINSTVAAVVASERFSDKRNSWIEETRLSGYKVLKQIELLARKTLMETVTSHASMRSVDADAKSIRKFQDIFIQNTIARLEILKADEVIDEADLPKLLMEDLTNEDLINHYDMNGMLEDIEDPENLLNDTNKLDFEE